MSFHHISCLIVKLLLSHLLCAQTPEVFQHQVNTPLKPWTDKDFYQNPMNFQFAIVSDRTGGHREGVFSKAVDKLNQLHPEFVMSVGDLIEGYAKDSLEVNRQWDEFQQILSDLSIRFFYLPGNHDISNSMMRNQWLARYGRSYYHFLYKDVLFLALDTNDGDGVVLSEAQITYIKETLAANTNVRWTLLFMHHPIWAYREYNNGFDQVEAALADRPYTVLAGHTHRYLQQVRNERNYYILGTTGGGSQLRGPRFGEYDHITWVTMTDEGPEFVNLQLSGIIDHNISTPASAAQARSLLQAAEMEPLVMKNEADDTYTLYTSLSNTADQPLYLQARFFHHHQVDITPAELDLPIAAQSTQQFRLTISPPQSPLPDQLDPLELDWKMYFKTDTLEPDFSLTGVLPIALEPSHTGLKVTERPIFLDTHKLTIEHPYEGLVVRYTLDGSDPTPSSPVYESPISIDATTTLQVSLFDPSGNQSAIYKQTYEKVTPLAPVKVGNTQPGLAYTYYEGNFLTLPDFARLTPERSGVAMEFDPEALAGDRLDHYAIQYTGYIDIPATGIYTFYLHSDDGSKLYIGEQMVVDNDGSHSARTRKGMIALEQGCHPIRVAYFEDFLGETLQMRYEGPEVELQDFPFERLTHVKNGELKP